MILPYEPYFPVSKFSELGIRETGYVLMIEVYRTCRRPVQTAQQIQEGALARSGLADDGNPFPAGDLELHIGEHDKIVIARNVSFR